MNRCWSLINFQLGYRTKSNIFCFDKTECDDGGGGPLVEDRRPPRNRRSVPRASDGSLAPAGRTDLRLEALYVPMRLRSPVDETDPSTHESPPDATGSAAGSTPVRTFLLVAGGTAAAAYALSRLRSSDGEPRSDDAPLETVRNRTAAAVPDEVADRVADAVPAEPQSIPIGGRESAERGADTGGESDAEDAARGPGSADSETPDGDTDADAGEPIDDGEMNADLADEPSSTKISSGSSEEIRDKPAEPGEMAVEDDVEELVDEADEEAGDRSDVDEDEE